MAINGLGEVAKAGGAGAAVIAGAAWVNGKRLSSLASHARFAGRLTATARRQVGLDGGTLPHERLLDQGPAAITRPTPAAKNGEVSKPIRYERCLDSYMNDVVTGLPSSQSIS